MTETNPGPRPRLLVAHPALQRVLVALHLYSAEGLICRASDEVLADSASVDRPGLAAALRSLTEAGWIRSLILPAGHPLPGRLIVLMDHEAASWYICEVRKAADAFLRINTDRNSRVTSAADGPPSRT